VLVSEEPAHGVAVHADGANVGRIGADVLDISGLGHIASLPEICWWGGFSIRSRPTILRKSSSLTRLSLEVTWLFAAVADALLAHLGQAFL
jgi:hypothetical protein